MWQNLRDIGGRNEPCPACGALPTEPTRALGTFVIEAEAIDVTEIDESEGAEGPSPKSFGAPEAPQG